MFLWSTCSKNRMSPTSLVRNLWGLLERTHPMCILCALSLYLYMSSRISFVKRLTWLIFFDLDPLFIFWLCIYRSYLFWFPDIMLISVRTFQGKVTTLEVQPTDTIQNVKRKIQDTEGTRTDLQRLMFANASLNNGRTLASYGIGEDAVLHLVLRKYFIWIIFIRIMLGNWLIFGECAQVSFI
jgi:hypothetical protein